MDCIRPATFLLPRGVDLGKWACIACDQHSANPTYWDERTSEVGKSPSTLKLILPEVFLSETDKLIESRLHAIQSTMDEYLSSGLLEKYRDQAVFLQRTTSTGDLRNSLIVEVDLEAYSYTHPETARIRPSEATVPERIPPRLRVRRGAALETSHVQLLFDDPSDSVFRLLESQEDSFGELYDFELPAGGGHVRGLAVPGATTLWQEVLDAFSALKAPTEYGYDFLVGDGNHSLATAKAYWEELKSAGAGPEHPARFTLVELINIHDPGLEFEPIHRLLQGVDSKHFLDFLTGKLNELPQSGPVALAQIICGEQNHQLEIHHGDDLPLNVLQAILDEYIGRFHPDNPQCLEYIHGEDEVRRMCRSHPEDVGILVPALPRSVLFPYVATHGATARKTFSLGHAADKRYYLELRDIRG